MRDEDAQLENQGDSKVGKLLLKHLYDQEAELSPRSEDKLGFFSVSLVAWLISNHMVERAHPRRAGCVERVLFAFSFAPLPQFT